MAAVHLHDLPNLALRLQLVQLDLGRADGLVAAQEASGGGSGFTRFVFSHNQKTELTKLTKTHFILAMLI